MKKAFRDIKRGVNKKVLKVPSIEQKVLDATSNEPWGPHGTHLIDIAQASRNYHEYQMIMSVLWKRLSDTGKNWRHVFKGLTVLEYLVINGSERVIEDIREHAFQITALASFQYIDSTGRDQGNNVRKKSQILVALVNDKEKLQEAREKANATRDKFRNTSGGTGDEGRFGNREEDRNGYGREREWGDDEYRGRSRSNDGDYGTRSQSSDRERERSFEDDGHRSSRGSSARVEDASPDGRGFEPKVSGQNGGGPPSYEDAVSNGHSPVDTKRDGEAATASPQVNINHQEIPAAAAPPPPPAAAATPPPVATTPPPAANNENEGFDFFDPRGAAPAPAIALPASGGGEMDDLFGSLSESFSSSSALALVTSTASITTEAHPPANTNPYLTFDTSSTSVGTQGFDDPFGDGPFKAVPSTDGFSGQPQTSPFTTTTAESPSFSVDPMSGSGQNLGFGDGFDFDSTVDILADILPPPGPSPTAFQTSQNGQGQPPSFSAEPNQTTFPESFSTPFGQSPTFSSQGQGGQPHHPFQPQPAQSIPQSAFQLPGGHQSMPQSASQFPGVQQSMPQSAALQLPGGHQSMMSQSAFQSPAVQQSMPQSAALQLPGVHQSMPQSAASQLPGVQQSMSQSAFQSPSVQQSAALQLQGGQQSMPQSASQLPGVQQTMPQSAFQVPGGQQSMALSGLQVQGGHQSIPQPNFPAQGGQYASQPGFPGQGSSSQNGGFSSQLGSVGVSNGFPAQGGQSMLQSQGSQSLLQPGFVAQNGQNASLGVSGFPSNGQFAQPNVSSQSQPGFNNSNGHAQPNNLYGGFHPQTSSATPTPAPHYNPSNYYQQQQQQQPALSASTGALALVPQQATDKKFETKSTVWADTLNRGLVNLNISGAKTNPLSDIGIDFEAINRKEKRMEKPSQTPVVSNVSMGKAMGSGSGMGRAGSGSGAVLRPAPNPMMGTGIGAPGGFNQPMGMNPMAQNMGIGMNMGQGYQMQQGFPPGPANYNNPMMGRGAAGPGYAQQPYGGYR